MKRLILLGSLILMCTVIHAQKWYEAGIRAGAGYSTKFTSAADSQVETSWKPGGHVGIYGSLFYSEKMAAQLEFLYSLKGSHCSDPDFSGDEDVSYVDLNLTARYQAMKLLNFHAGPQFSFLTGAWRDPDDAAAYGIKEYYMDVDFGLLVGAELNLPIGLNIALRYNEGLIRVSKTSYYTDPWKNRVLQLSLSFAIWGD